MDSSSSPHNWLGFSLSNQQPHLSLFQSFNSNPSPQQHATSNTATTDLSIYTSAPKLEDFLGCSNTTTTHSQGLHLGHQFPNDPTEIYDSDLKNIAASFLTAYSSTEQQQQQQPQNDAQKQLVVPPAEIAPKKTVDTFGQRTSIYRGVTRHRWTGRYEAHLWDNSCRREGQTRKGRQVYLGGYDKEDKAARAYDLAALKYWGPTTTTNFPVSNYEKELEDMKNMTRQEFVASLRRKSSGFSRGASIYRGVTRHHQHGRWQARIGRVAGNKDLYLGTFSTQEEAAEAYDIAAIKFRGLNAVTNFDMSRYDVKSIANSNLPIGGMSGKSKNSSESNSDSKYEDRELSIGSSSSIKFASQPATSTLSFAMPTKEQDQHSDYWSLFGYHNTNVTPQQTMLQSSTNGSVYEGQTSFNMEFSAMTESNNNGLFNGGYTSTSTSSIAFATPISMNGNENRNNNYEGSGYGNWVATSLHTFPSAKANLSVFQTPIYGIE